MARLILFVFLLVGVALAFAAVMLALRALGPRPEPQRGDTLPTTFRTIAYVLLLLLMLGITTGLIGAA